MKRLILVGFVVLTAMSGAPTAQGQQQPQRFIVRSGVVSLGPNQAFQTTVEAPPLEHVLQFRRRDYMEDMCVGNVCKHVISEQSSTGPIQVAPGEAISMNISNTGGGTLTIAVDVVTNRRDVAVNFAVMNTVTGEIVASFGIDTVLRDDL